MNKWFLYFLVRAISQRKGRFIISSSAVMLAVSVVTALYTMSSGVGEKIGNELKQYGANMIVTEKTGAAIERHIAEELRSSFQNIRDAAFQVYGLASMEGKTIEIIAMEPDKMSGFRIKGDLPRKDDEIIIGANIHDQIGVEPGKKVKFENGMEFRVSGIFEKGSEEDAAMVITLRAAPELLGITGISAVLLNVDTKYLDRIKSEITEKYPSLHVKTIRQVAVAEERLLARMQLLVFIVTVAVIFASMIALGSTMGANVIERIEEIGLLKAIGATEGKIRNFFMTESALAGLAGAVVGYVFGIVAAETVSRAAFGSYVHVDLFFIMVAVAVGVIISVFSTLFPVRDALKVVPARILRGE